MIDYKFEISQLDWAWTMFEKTNDRFYIRYITSWCKDMRRLYFNR